MAAGMLLLSRITGRDVRGPDGRVLGRIADVTARVDGSIPRVERILLHGKHDLLVPWEAVVSFNHNGIRLSSDGTDFTIGHIVVALDDNEILLGRDVLDTQVVDIGGQRLARVADVVLAHRPGGVVEVVGVEVGFAGVLRRLGFGPLARRVPRDAVAWSDLHLTSERGHAVQLAMPRSAIHLLDARGLAALVARLDTDSAAEVLSTKGPAVAADVIRASHPVVSERMLRAMGDTEAADIIAVMPAHHAARWRDLLATPQALRGRHFRRFRIWPRRRHTLRAAGP
jgi:sporulation protein YlmC with PRC-barrel domain